jgi:hypothetical protein
MGTGIWIRQANDCRHTADWTKRKLVLKDCDDDIVPPALFPVTESGEAANMLGDICEYCVSMLLLWPLNHAKRMLEKDHSVVVMAMQRKIRSNRTAAAADDVER